MEIINGGIAAPQGYLAAGVIAEIRKKEKKDVALVYSETVANAAGVYTINKFKAAPLQITARHLEDGKAQAIVVNSGVANACMGEEGLKAAEKMAELTAEVLNISPEDVIVASTGLIGAPLPLDNVARGIKEAYQELSKIGADFAAEAIMTTDLAKKEIAIELELSGKKVKIGAMAKGSGMIHPNMATMLGFITTDAAIEADVLQMLLSDTIKGTFNMISVDGDTSTNDMVVILANGMAGTTTLIPGSEDFSNFKKALFFVCQELAKKIAADGEGATKLLEVTVENAPTLEDARKGARSIISSNLVKSAIFGEDANWGRIVTALGYSGAEFDPGRVDVFIGDLAVAKNGAGLVFDEIRAREILGQKEVQIRLDLQVGREKATAWGCDLSFEYIKINAEYRS